MARGKNSTTTSNALTTTNQQRQVAGYRQPRSSNYHEHKSVDHGREIEGMLEAMKRSLSEQTTSCITLKKSLHDKALELCLKRSALLETDVLVVAGLCIRDFDAKLASIR